MQSFLYRLIYRPAHRGSTSQRQTLQYQSSNLNAASMMLSTTKSKKLEHICECFPYSTCTLLFCYSVLLWFQSPKCPPNRPNQGSKKATILIKLLHVFLLNVFFPSLPIPSLVCAVSYTTQYGEKLYFRKFFKFQVSDIWAFSLDDSGKLACKLGRDLRNVTGP